jgi:phosphatidate cytidylyltransferase
MMHPNYNNNAKVIRMFERIRTGLILIAIVLVCLFATKSSIPMLLLMAVTVAVGATEWTKFGRGHGREYHQPKLYVALTFVLAAIAASPLLLLPHMGFAVGDIYLPKEWPIIWAVADVFWLSALVTVVNYPKPGITNERWLPEIGVLLIIGCTLAIFALWSASPWWLMYLFGLVWVADSGAYFTGKFLGKHKLIPDVSPNKTIEGLLGGLVLTLILIAAVAHHQQLESTKLIVFVALSIVTVLASVLGDLFESLLKRKANIKDSGSLLPGHGGVLDRIDSILAAAPIFALGFTLAGGF